MAWPGESQPGAVHELWLPPDTDPVAVHRLVDDRYPHSRRIDDPDRQRRWSLSRWSTLSAPEVDPSGRIVWTVRTLRERDEPPLPGLTDPDGLYRAFPGGRPILEEGRVVASLLGMARRLGGELVLDIGPDGTGRLLRPDPLARINLSVYSTVGMTPEVLAAVVAAVEPTAKLAMEGHPWRGPLFEPGDPYAEPQTEFLAAISPAERARTAAFSEAFDAAALAQPDAVDAYAVEVDLDWAGVLVVEAHAEDNLPPQLRTLEWTEPVAYDVRWLPVDAKQAERDEPSGAYRHARATALPRLQAVTKAVAQAAAGRVFDADGFSVDAHSL